MQLVKSIIPKKIKTLYQPATPKKVTRLTLLIFLISAFEPAFSQDNSPYSRYGIGDLVPPTHISSRSMGGISAAYADAYSINFNNPASYSSFFAFKEAKSKKMVSGRAVLDVGVNVENRTLREPSNPEKFTASNALFSYVQIGAPVRNNWGISFGLRPISRISYKIDRFERLKDPNTGLPIDSSITLFQGDGGAYLASFGTGFSLYSKMKHQLQEKLSIGATAGYLFGRKDYSTRRSFINDTVNYYQANYETKANYGNLYFNTGIQYQLPLSQKMVLALGAYGSWSQKMNSKQDVLRETFSYDDANGYLRLDSVSDLKDVKGTITLPATFTAGFVLHKLPVVNKEGGWMIGVDFEKQNWDQYRYYGQADSVKNKWELRLGAQLNPVPKRNYFSNVVYRFGMFTGPDYIRVGQKLNQMGFTLGFGLPIPSNSLAARNLSSILNLSIEYIKRGNNDNLLKEDLFRVSLGFSLSDIWFGKRKYD